MGDGQPGSYAGPQVCNRTNEISLTPQKSASRKRDAVDHGQCSDLLEARFCGIWRATFQDTTLGSMCFDEGDDVYWE